jgi:hypothetical protein
MGLQSRIVTRLCRVIGIAFIAASVVSATMAARQSVGDQGDLGTVLERVGEGVERYFARAQRIVCLETVTLLPLGTAPGLDAMSREIQSDLSLAWDAAGAGGSARDIKTIRRVLRVNGRPPRRGDPRDCTTPEQTETEAAPLSLLLPAERDQYRFKLAGTRRVQGREALLVDFVEKAPVTVESSLVDGRDDCISYTIEGGARGRVWIDADTYDVLRMDQHLPGMLDIPLPRTLARRYGPGTALTLERSDTSIQFEPVVFRDPDEVLILPVSVIEMRETRGSGVRRLRTTTAYTDYRRFLTGSRIVR